MAEPADSASQPAEGEVLPAPAEAAAVGGLPTRVGGRGDLNLPRPAFVPATLVAATGGFLLGVATFLFARLLRRRVPARSLIRRHSALARRPGVKAQATRSLLIDVHVLKR